MFDFDALEDAPASLQNFDFDAFEDAFAKNNGPTQIHLDENSQNLMHARALELSILSRLPWTVPLPKKYVIGAKIKVRTVQGNSNLEQYGGDALTKVARRLDSLCKKLDSTNVLKDELSSVYMLFGHVMHGIIEEGEPVQDWCQRIHDCLAAFAGVLSDIANSGNTIHDSSEAIKESWDSSLVEILQLLKRLLDCCMFEMPGEKERAWSVYHALEGPSHSEIVAGLREWSEHNHFLSEGNLRILRTTPLTATRCLFDLRMLMQDDDFHRKYHMLRCSSSAQAKHDAGKLVLDIYERVLSRYGFDCDPKGVMAMRNECGAYATIDVCVHKLRSDIHYLLETDRFADLSNQYTNITLQHVFQKLPLVSVVIPTHRGRLHSLRGAVLSAMTQTYGNVEITISVQNISDWMDTKYFEVVRNEFYDQAGVTVVSASAHGEIPDWWEGSRRQSRCAFVRNAALRDIKGDFVAFLDDDDVWLQWKLSEQLSAMFKAKSEFSATEAFGGDLHQLRPWNPFSWQQGESLPAGFLEFNRDMNHDVLKLLVPEYSPEDSHISMDVLKKHNVIVTSTVIMSTALLKRVGLMSETATNEDHDFWCRAAEVAGPILSVPEAMSVYDCFHGSSNQSDEAHDFEGTC